MYIYEHFHSLVLWNSAQLLSKKKCFDLSGQKIAADIHFILIYSFEFVITTTIRENLYIHFVLNPVLYLSFHICI